MKKIILYICFTFYMTSAFCQSVNVYDLGLNCIKKNQYLKAIDTLNILRNVYYQTHKSDPEQLSLYSYDQAINLFTSFIGEDYPYKFSNQSGLKNTKSSFTAAIPYIINQAKEHQVVMINENHYTTKHRILTYNLLKAFYGIGYRYLALEALTPGDSVSLDRDKAAVYVEEPNMANLIKEAKRLGFKLIAYEAQDNTPDNPNFPNYHRNMRELLEARNLYQVIVKDPQAKILVHAGVAHIWEQAATDKGMYMAEYFKVISGIDPLTINQSVLNEDEFTKQLDESTDLKTGSAPYVVLDSLNSPKISSADRKGDYDLIVSWPSPKIILGRKDYMLGKQGTHNYIIDLKVGDEGNLVQVFEFNDDKGVPVDQFKVKKGDRKVGTALNSGKYQVQLVDSNGKIVWKKLINI